MQLNEIFEHIPIAMVLVRENGEIESINNYTSKLFQYESHELVGKKVELLIPENIRENHPKLMAHYFKAPTPRKMGEGKVLLALKRDGTTFPVEVGLNPIIHEGKVLALAIILDISDRQVAEERFRTAFDAAPNGMLMIDRSRKIVLINRKIEEIFGYDRGELLGSYIETLVPDDFKNPHPKFVESYLQKPVARSMGIGRELFGKHKTGKLIPVEIGLQPIFVGQDTFVISSIVDISVRRQIEEELKRKTEELAEFSYRTSHDLRSPLKTICGMSDGIAESLKENDLESVKKYNEKVGLLAAKLNDLIESIMNLTKVELTSEPNSLFDFAQYAQDSKLKFESLLVENKVKLEFNFFHDKALLTQGTRLTQVLDNLISNAVKYSDSKKTESFVRIKTFSGAKTFMINVEDNGVGIPASKQNEVFGMFKRFHSTKASGSGLGLYLIKKQVDHLAASISFKSSDEGTVFYLELPLD